MASNKITIATFEGSWQNYAGVTVGYFTVIGEEDKIELLEGFNNLTVGEEYILLKDNIMVNDTTVYYSGVVYSSFRETKLLSLYGWYESYFENILEVISKDGEVVTFNPLEEDKKYIESDRYKELGEKLQKRDIYNLNIIVSTFEESDENYEKVLTALGK